MRNINKGDLLLYRDQKGKFTLYECLSVESSTKPVQYAVQLATKYDMEQYKKGSHVKRFTTSMRTKDGTRRLFKFWLVFNESYTFYQKGRVVKGVLKNYYYDNSGVLIFNVQKSNGQLIGFTVEQLKNVEYA